MLNKKKGSIAISQILILVIGIVAISYAIGSEVKVVSGADYEIGYFDTDDSWVKSDEGAYKKNLETGVVSWADSSITDSLPADVITNNELYEGTDPIDPTYDEDWDTGVYGAPTAPSTTGKPVDYTSDADPGAATGDPLKETDAEKAARLAKEKAAKKAAEKPKFGSEEGVLGVASWFLEAVMYAAMVYGLVTMLGPMFEMSDAETQAAAEGAGLGMLAGQIAAEALGSATWGGVIGLAVAVAYYFYAYEEETQEIVIFTCYAWDAPTRGEHCEKCNKQGELPCSEYQCRSLGQACQLLNPGTDEEKCVWVNRNDIEFPTIEPWIDALLDDYTYKPDGTISPPDRGVIIEYTPKTDKCVPAFKPFSFGIFLDEPAKCKIDYLRKDTFDDMDFYFSGGLLKYNHSYALSLPGPSESENITIRNDGEFELYVRCQDANGNHNTANFVFKFCVDQGPDTTPPLIVTTTPLNGFPITFNKTSIDIEVDVNEPVECKWSHREQSYENMPDEMNNDNAKLVSDMNEQGLYTLTTTLTGLKDRQENKFYFRCKDQPSAAEKDRFAMAESYEFILIGTQPLVIDWVKPEEGSIIKDSTDVVKVTLEARTSAGYREGEASCYYSESCYDKDKSLEDYIMFGYETGEMSYEHSQELWMDAETYECSIKCIDLGGNPDNKTVTFTVETDRDEPIVVRAYHEDTYLKIITNEPAECVYDTTDCSYVFKDGIKMTAIDNTNHFTDWKTDTDFYIKCRDEYGNQPNPNECSIIVRPFEVYEDE